MNNNKNLKERYPSIDGLRTIACIGIVLLHIKANIDHILPGFWANMFISSFRNFVFLFMSISAFVLSCGYFQKIKNNDITPEKFYSKRIYRLLPFFLLLTLLDLIVEHNIPSLIESFANITLLFGLLGKDITVIGVGWFIGLLFIFYLMFPYFTYLFSNKKRAWITTIAAILMNLSCVYYFNIGKGNMFYSFIYFCIGGIIYLYKDRIIEFMKNKKTISFALLIISILLFYILSLYTNVNELPGNILVIISFLIYAISFNSKILSNRITNFIGNISLEIYLCHMFIFRIIEKTGIFKLLDNSWISYILLTVLVLFGTIAFSLIYKKAWNFLENNLKQKQ